MHQTLQVPTLRQTWSPLKNNGLWFLFGLFHFTFTQLISASSTALHQDMFVQVKHPEMCSCARINSSSEFEKTVHIFSAKCKKMQRSQRRRRAKIKPPRFEVIHKTSQLTLHFGAAASSSCAPFEWQAFCRGTQVLLLFDKGWGYAQELQGRKNPPISNLPVEHVMSAFTVVRWDDEAGRLVPSRRWEWGCCEETPHGQMDGQTSRKWRTDGNVATEGVTLTSFSGVCRHFGGLLRRFCQCISFSWFACVPSLSCVLGDQLSLACRNTECSTCDDPAKQSKHKRWRALFDTFFIDLLKKRKALYTARTIFEYTQGKKITNKTVLQSKSPKSWIWSSVAGSSWRNMVIQCNGIGHDGMQREIKHLFLPLMMLKVPL